MDPDDIDLLAHVRKQLERPNEDILEAVRRRGVPNLPDPMAGEARASFETGLTQCKKAILKRVDEKDFVRALALLTAYAGTLVRDYGPAAGTEHTPSEVDATRQWLAALMLDISVLKKGS